MESVGDALGLLPGTESIIESMGVGLVSLDRSWRLTGVNDAAAAVLGRPASELVGRSLWEELPEVRGHEFGRVCESVMRTARPASSDAWYPDLGAWFELRARPAADGIVCYFLDITARKSAEQGVVAAAERSRFVADAMESLAATLDLTANVEHLARLVVPELCSWSIVTVVDDDGTVTGSASWHRDPARRDDVARLAAAQHAALGESLIGQVLEHGRAAVLAADAQVRPRSHGPQTARVILDELDPRAAAVVPMTARGRTVGVLSLYSETPWTEDRADVARDIAARAAVAIDNSLAYARVETARRDAEAVGRRLSLLARVSEVLSDTTDLDAAVGRLAGLMVPALADWSLVTVVEADGNLRDVGYAHRDAALVPVLAAYSARRSISMTDTAPRSTVLRAGEPLVYARFTTEDLARAQPDPSTFALAHSLDPYGLATIPLTSRGRTFGVITLATTSTRGSHTPDEVADALEIARRAGPVLETARAAQHARQLAESVQRTVLAVSPSPAGLQIATRYRPANVDHQVGGDWYDTFTSPDGSTIVTIGDVMGHDVAAIAAMAQLRTFMQACAWTLQHSPAEVLSVTDRAAFSLGRPMFATALTADLSPPEGDGTVHLRWSNAGHLPAVLLTPEGEVSLLRATPVDPPLGVIAGVTRREHSRALAPGSVVLLYTDGLIERRDRDLDDGLAELTATVRTLRDVDLESLLDTLLLRLTLGAPGTDDIALLAVRVGPEVPRPAAIPLPNDLAAARVARDEVRARCAHLPPDRLEDAVLLTSELVGNALRHGSAPYVLRVQPSETGVRVSVTDAGANDLTLPDGTPDLHKPSGRGLLIVATLATEWSVVRDADGKTVWFTVEAAPVG